MTRWGALLLVSFVALGLAPRLSTPAAIRAAALLTAFLLVFVRFAVW